VSAVVQHLGIELEEVFVDLLKGENQSPEYLAVNPNGMAPALVDGDVVLWEAAAIMIYLAEKVDETELWPRGVARYDVLRWVFWAAEHFRQPAPMYFEERLAARLMGRPADESRIAEANRRLVRFAPVLDAHLENRSYVVGNHVTLADFDLAAPLSQMPRTAVPYHEYANIMQWSERLTEEVPAWGETGKRLDARMDQAAEATGLRFDN
jgi:glutathione S-transferase